MFIAGRSWPIAALFAVLAALPAGYAGAIQNELRIEDAYLAWLFGDFALGAAAVLFLGPQAVARWGTGWVRTGALAGLAGSAALAAAADLQQTLFAARWLQGAFGMLLMWTVASTAPHARSSWEHVRQAALPAAALASGIPAGLLGGMALSSHVTWRWMFAAVTGLAVAAMAVLAHPAVKPSPPRAWSARLPALLLATGAMQCLVYGVTDIAARGRWDGVALPLFGCAVLLGAAAHTVRRTGSGVPAA